MRFILYHHKNKALAEYLVTYSPRLAAASKSGELAIISLPQQTTSTDYAELPTALRKLLFFARPDCVICLDDGIREIHPVFAIELTESVPAQDHWMQRFNNLVGCSLEKVPGAYILPFEMPNHPKFKSSLDAVFFYAYERVTEIHQTPTYIAEWETEGGKNLVNDSSPKFAGMPNHKSPDLKRTFQFLDRVLDCAIHGRPTEELMRERLIVNLRDQLRRRAYATLPKPTDFRRLQFCLKGNDFFNEEEFDGWLVERKISKPSDMPDRISLRKRYLIWTPQIERSGKTAIELRQTLVARIRDKGGSPYEGQPLAFDYMFCRLGETPHQRDTNLVIDLGVLRFSDFAEYHKKIWEKSPLQYTDLKKIQHIPTYTMHLKEGFSQAFKNVIRLYSFAADIIVFEDGLIYF